ncbi:MAG: ribosome maturation factor RimM [Acidobacteriota bacterium]
MTEAEWDALVVVGRVARPHGRWGEVILNAETDFPEERFRPGRQLLTRRGVDVMALTVRSARIQQGRPVLGFAGVESIDDAQALAGCELRIAVADLVPLPPGMFYQHDLVGCRVETVDGIDLGVVAAVDGSGAASRLVVDGPAGEQLIPLTQDICRIVDPAARRIVIAPPDGLLGLNDTRRSRQARRSSGP